MLIAGLIVLVVAIGLIIAAVLQRKRGMSLAGSEELTVSDVLAQITAAAAALGPGNYRKHVAVSGQLVPSPNGELLSPLTRTPCVWHRTVIRRRHYEWVTENNQRRRQETTSLEHEASSEQPFGISDGTATVAIDPSKARIDGAEKVLDVYEPQQTGGGFSTGVDVEVFGIRVSSGSGADSGTDTLGYERVETVLRPGATMHVIGTVSDRTGAPRIAEQDGTKVQISTRSRGELRHLDGEERATVHDCRHRGVDHRPGADDHRPGAVALRSSISINAPSTRTQRYEYFRPESATFGGFPRKDHQTPHCDRCHDHFSAHTGQRRPAHCRAGPSDPPSRAHRRPGRRRC